MQQFDLKFVSPGYKNDLASLATAFERLKTLTCDRCKLAPNQNPFGTYGYDEAVEKLSMRVAFEVAGEGLRQKLWREWRNEPLQGLTTNDVAKMVVARLKREYVDADVTDVGAVCIKGFRPTLKDRLGALAQRLGLN
ncbi:MAG: hypothetical protein ABTQ34_08405 [Bdellovibrionales bacterium]